MKEIVKDMNVVPEQALVLNVLSVNVQKHKYSKEAVAAHYEYEIVLAVDEKNFFYRYCKNEDDELVVEKARSFRINHRQLRRLVRLGGAKVLDSYRQFHNLNWSDQATWSPMVGGKVAIKVTPYSEGDTYTIEEDGEEIEVEYESDGCKVEVLDFIVPTSFERLFCAARAGMKFEFDDLFESMQKTRLPKIEKNNIENNVENNESATI